MVANVVTPGFVPNTSEWPDFIGVIPGEFAQGSLSKSRRVGKDRWGSNKTAEGEETVGQSMHAIGWGVRSGAVDGPQLQPCSNSRPAATAGTTAAAAADALSAAAAAAVQV